VKALTLWQPWASLVALGVKSIETRSWSTSYRGPLAIHASKRPADQSNLRLWMPLHSAMKRTLPCGTCGHADGFHACHMTFTRCICNCDGWTEPPLPLGAVVATSTLVDVVPTLAAEDTIDQAWMPHVAPTKQGDLWLWEGPGEVENLSTGRLPWRHRDIEDQRPYGDFSPGRHAWLLADIEPLAEPIPAKGRQGLWEWTP
jgi:hypothetical protein